MFLNLSFVLHLVLFCKFQASKKKVFMLYNMEPDRSVTGGAWYSDQDFESEFVDVLNTQCHKFLEQKVTTQIKFNIYNNGIHCVIMNKEREKNLK